MCVCFDGIYYFVNISWPFFCECIIKVLLLREFCWSFFFSIEQSMTRISCLKTKFIGSLRCNI